jgi:hypothetical protein
MIAQVLPTNVLLALLILTGESPAPSDAARPEAARVSPVVESSFVFQCGCDDDVDRNYDGWPDN